MMISDQGGMNIEEVAEKTPELIHHMKIDPTVGIQPFQVRNAAAKMNLDMKFTSSSYFII